MTNVLLLAPLYANGGISSWTKKFIKTFPSEEFRLFPVSQVLGDKGLLNSFWKRTEIGLKEVSYILKELKKCIVENDIELLHTTTSGSLGTYRDYRVVRLCKRLNVRTIIHCRYGCIPQILEKGGLHKTLLLKTMRLYDQVWVLDRKSLKALSAIRGLEGKIRLTPNSMMVEPVEKIEPKEFVNFAFVANVLPTKGIFELIEAVKKVERPIRLHIVGPGNPPILERMKAACGDLWDGKIKYYGRLPNDEAVEFMKGMDSLVLPTYFAAEAFPISILEAMSNGKLVISTPRAAIEDMLTALDGSRCGILVPEKSVDELAEAITWAYDHKTEADELCRKAYEKVYNAYRTDVVYELYRENYRAVLAREKVKGKNEWE